MKAGLESCGEKVHISQKHDSSDVHVFWGLRRPWGRQAIKNNLPSIIIERAYLGNRFKWLAFGLNGLNGYADFCNENVPDDRWKKFWRDDMKPWKQSSGSCALIIGQVPGDASLNGKNIFDWLVQIIPQVQQRFKEVIVRPHPLMRNKRALQFNMKRFKRIFNKVTMDYGDLAQSLAKASVVITYTSNVAVDAVMAGVPAISFDRGSMAWDVTTHNLDDPLFRGDREDWGRKIAYAQWLPLELKSGAAWNHVKEHLCRSE
jgi:hypothetical protein